MHTDLSPSLHTEQCNILIQKLMDCRMEHPVRKFMGYCNQPYYEMTKCLKQERLRRVKANYDESRRRHAEIRARIRAQEENQTN